MHRPYKLVLSYQARFKGGKSTQAKKTGPILQQRGSTGPYKVIDGGMLVRNVLYMPDADSVLDVPIDIGDGEVTTLRHERKENDAGRKATPKWLLNCLIFPQMEQLLKGGTSVIFAGQPRYADEAQQYVEVIRASGAEILVVEIDVDLEVCRERAERWYEELTPEQKRQEGYKWLKFDERAEDYETFVPAAMDVLVAASGLLQPRVVIRDDGTMSIKAVTDAIVEAVSKALP